MAGMFDEWDAKRDRAARPAEPQPSPLAPADLDRAAKYARAALDGEVANIIAVPIGSGRNDQLNKSAVKMGHYIAAGAIDERSVVEVLGAADGGLDYPATAKTITSGIEAGKRVPAIIPDARPSGQRPAPWEEPSDDPFSPSYVAPSTPGPDPTPTTVDGEALNGAETPIEADPAYRAAVVLEARTQRLRRDARRLLDHEDAERDFRVPPFLDTLADELALPDDPITYAVDEVFPTGANVLLTAQYKTGKTTMVNNLARAFVDGDPFLGRFIPSPPDGRVVIFNYEVDRAQYRRWLRDVDFRHADRVVVLNLRGYRVPLDVPHIETWVVEFLKRSEAAVWIVDPFARASVGIDENSNGEVGQWLDTLDVIKGRAGVTELVLPTHTGRAEVEVGDERSRGATRLEDWCDVRWLLTKDKGDTRYFRATGRDVEVDEGALTFDNVSRRLTLTDGDRRTVEDRRYDDAVRTVLATKPGASSRELREGVKQILGRSTETKVDDAVRRLIARHEVRAEDEDRKGIPTRHFLTGPAPDPFGGVST